MKKIYIKTKHFPTYFFETSTVCISLIQLPSRPIIYARFMPKSLHNSPTLGENGRQTYATYLPPPPSPDPIPQMENPK